METIKVIGYIIYGIIAVVMLIAIVIQIVEYAFAVLVHAAYAELVRRYPAAPLAGGAPYARIGQLLVEHRLLHKVPPINYTTYQQIENRARPLTMPG